jgi:hypothetical protein
MPYGHQPICYIGEVGPAAAVSRDIPNLGPWVSIVDHEGKLVGRFGDTPAGTELGKFLAPHGLAVDGHGDIMSARSPGPLGRRSTRASRTRPICARCRNSRRVE